MICTILAMGHLAAAAPAERPAGSQCATCHAGIEWIREPDTGMMQDILTRGAARGDPAGCTVCHGGDPQASTAEAAHAGSDFYAEPSSPWINERTCEACHVSEKVLGYGIDGGRLMRGWDKPQFVDLTTADGRVLPRHARPQIEPIAGLTDDWSHVVTEGGQQLMTVGHHLTRSRPLNTAEWDNMNRAGICLSCHQEIPAASIAVRALHQAGRMADLLPRTPAEHATLVHKVLLTAAWAQVGLAVAGLGGGLGMILLALRFKRRRRKTAPVMQVPPDSS